MKKGKLVIMTLILIAGVLSPASGACAGTRKLTVVYTEWYPYTYQEQGAARGFEIETLKAVLARMSLEAEFVQRPWKRCLKMLGDGKADALVSMLKAPDRDVYTIYPKEHISISKTLLFARRGSDIAYSGSFQDLKRYTIGVIAGFTYGPSFDGATYLKKEEVQDAETLIRMVTKGRHDLGVENQVVVASLANRLGVRQEIRFLYPPVHVQKLYVGFSKKKGLTKMAVDFSHALQRFKKTEEYRAILTRYGISFAEMTQE